MNTIALLTLLAASPASLSELIAFNQNTPQTTLEQWRQRADPSRRALLERWLALPPGTSIDAKLEMLTDYALTLDDPDALTTLLGIIYADNARQSLGSPLLISTEKRRVIRKHAALFLQHTPDNETAWQILVLAAPDDDERAFILEQCVKRAPALAYCRSVQSPPRCVRARQQLRWVHDGRTLTPEAVAGFVFKPDAPSDVLVKLAPGVPEPALFMIRTPMHDDDIQLFDGEKRIGYAQPPKHDEKFVALRTIGTTLDETMKLLCAEAEPDRPVE